MEPSFRLPLIVSTPSGHSFAQGIERHLRETYLPRQWGRSRYNPENHDIWVQSKITRFADTDIATTIERHIRDEDVYVVADVYNQAVPLPRFPEGKETGYVATMTREDVEVEVDGKIIKEKPHKLTVSENFDMLLTTLNATRNAVKQGRITVVLPCFPSARQERRGGRKSLDMKRRIQEVEEYVDHILCIDIHNPGAAENAVESRVGFDQLSATQTFIEFLESNTKDYDPKEMVWIAPDHGSKERNKKFAEYFKSPLGIYDKERDQNVPNRVKDNVALPLMGLSKSDIRKKHIYLNDDIFDTGGTIKEATKRLHYEGETQGAVVLATHPIFSHPIRMRLQEAYRNGSIREVIVTNSVKLKKSDYHLPYLRVVDISKLVAKAIDSLNTGKSISALVEDTI